MLEVALPFAAAAVVFIAAMYEPVMSNGIAVISLMGIGAYYYFMK